MIRSDLSRSKRRRRARWVTASVVMALVLMLVQPASGWKPNTHMWGTDHVLADLRDGNTVTIGGQEYDVDERIAEAIRENEAHYRGGSIGPDGFPDLVFGQTIIHPDRSGYPTYGTTSDDWLQYLYDEAWDYYHRCKRQAPLPIDLSDNDDEPCPDSADAVLAFTYGYLTHGVGDVWGHTVVNDFSRGNWPDLPDDLDIAVRHLIVEGFIDKHIDGDPDEIDAPVGFLYKVFIESELGRNMAPGSLFHTFYDLRHELDKARRELATNTPEEWVLCTVTGGVTCAVAEAARGYIDAWIADIDQGMLEWPALNLEVARALYVDEGFDAALDLLEDFVHFRVLSMIGLPDAIGNFTGEVSDVLDAVKGQFKEVRVVLDALNPLEDILIWFAREAFGIDVNQWKEFVVSPERYINCEDTPVGLGYTIGLDENTSAYLSELMRVPSVDYGCGDPAKEDFVPFDPGEFEPFYNTVVMSKLLLLDGEELNRLLYDHHVGALFDESTWYDREAPRPNLGLGWIATLDGNHQWRETAPAHAPNAEEPFSVDGEGMPLWVDCLARKRVFRYSEEFGTGLFKDWTGTGENELGDHGENCRGDSVKLPPIEFEMKLLKPNGEEEIAPFEEVCFGCLVVLRLLNHQDQGTEQDYVVYVRAHDEADGRVVFHHAEPGSVAGYDTSQHEILFRACDGVYDVHGFLFQNMLSWDVADPITSPPIQPVPPDLPMPVASPQTGNVWVTTDPRRCPTRTTVCTEFPVPGSTSASWLGGGCTESQEVESEVDCADEPLLADDECADTDQDGIPDIWDNCPTVFNPYQTEIAGCGGPAQIPEHIVDLAELYVDDPRVGEVMDFLDGVLPQFRGLEPWCLTCDSVFDSIEPSLAAFSRDFMSGSVSQDRYVADVASLVIGPVIRGPDVRIRQAAIEDRRGAATLRMDLDSRATGRMTIVVPHSILRGGGITGTAFDVLVDGRPTTFTQMNSLQATTFEFTTQRASQIAIVGVETGPQADTALDGAFKLASRINSLFRERP